MSRESIENNKVIEGGHKIKITDSGYAGTYYRGKKIGGGDRGTVYQYINKETGQAIAVKVLLQRSDETESEFLANTEREQRITQLAHKFCERIILGNTAYLAMPEFPGKHVNEQIRSASYPKNLEICYATFIAILALHKKGIAHRDLGRLLNVKAKVDPIQIFIYDFDQSREFKHGDPKMQKSVERDTKAIVQNCFSWLKKLPDPVKTKIDDLNDGVRNQKITLFKVVEGVKEIITEAQQTDKTASAT